MVEGAWISNVASRRLGCIHDCGDGPADLWSATGELARERSGIGRCICADVEYHALARQHHSFNDRPGDFVLLRTGCPSTLALGHTWFSVCCNRLDYCISRFFILCSEFLLV